jgi:hypothetical protein
MVLTDDEAIAKKINSAVFPGLQGGPLMHVIAAKAVAFGEALQPEFKTYAKAVIANAKALGPPLERARRGSRGRREPTRTSRWSISGRSASPARMPTRVSSMRASPATRTAFRSTPIAAGQDPGHPRRLSSLGTTAASASRKVLRTIGRQGRGRSRRPHQRTAWRTMAKSELARLNGARA